MRRRWHHLILGAAILTLPASLWGVGQSTPADESGFTMALTGDAILTQRLAVHSEPAFLGVIDLIRNADVAFTNLEMLFHDYEPYPMHASGGIHLRADPALLKDLVWAGVDVVSLANNHIGDYGVLGMQLTARHAREAGLVAAGVGDSLAEAREAKFVETGRGRVALVSVASTFPDHSRASRSRDDMPARPGLNPLRFTTTYTVTAERFGMLRDAMGELGFRGPADDGILDVLGNRFVAGDAPDVMTVPLEEDVREIAAVVSNASRLADYTIVTIHAHEGDRDRFVPARFLVTFARAMIDAGADIFVGHGPHVLRGIEIYHEKPILYSLGDFIFENETVQRLSSETYEAMDLGPTAHVADFNDRRYDLDRRGFPADPEIWESVVAVPRWDAGRLVDLRLHPIGLGFGLSRVDRGRPMLAEPALGGKILDNLARRSEAFGTTIDVQDGIGIVRVR